MPFQFRRRQDAEVAPDDQLRVTVKTAATHQPVLVLGKCDRPTGQRRTVRQVQIVQQCQRVPLGKRRLNRAVRQPDSHGLPKRFQRKRIVRILYAGLFCNILRYVLRQPLLCDGKHRFKLTVFHTLTSVPILPCCWAVFNCAVSMTFRLAPARPASARQRFCHPHT